MLSYFQNTLYVQIAPERLTVRNPKTGESFSEPAEVAISFGSKAKIVGIGADARAAQVDPSVKVIHPFAHPRSLVSDFTVAEQLLKAVIRQMQGRSLLSFAPKIVMHPLGEPAGGFTQVEIRAFHELALGAGASTVKIWHGRELTDQELQSKDFPAQGQLLL